MAKLTKALGIIGGTFNPVHIAHLRIAIDFAESFNLSQVSLMPCAEPVHRDQPDVATEDRVAMLELAVKASEKIAIDLREVKRKGPSFTVDSLAQIRAECGDDTALYFAMGTDAFQQITTWHCYQQLFDLANIVVMHRPESAFALNEPYFLERQQSFTGEHQAAGALYELPVSALAVSSTMLREKIKAGRSVDFLVPPEVQNYIAEHQLYR
jgi:nicotinate-nucleotide adenylyltransferase